MTQAARYWKKVCGIELYKVQYFLKWMLYNALRVRLPKLRDQRNYWTDRGTVYMDEILSSGYLEREVFFQNLMINFLKGIPFKSFFEAGCGFGWNIKRVAETFPYARVGGLDFSLTQLNNSKSYLEGQHLPIVNGDNCHMPLVDNAFDVGFSLGVFMNIHPDKIQSAVKEMVRVCSKYIIHIEYDQNHTTETLRKKRAFKTNIVSHDYRALYEALGQKVIEFSTYKEFAEGYDNHAHAITGQLNRWEGFEGPEKYIFMVVKVTE